MTTPFNAHRHFAAYGICVHDGKLLAIHKNKGPYAGRYDLPGGSIEPNESLSAAVKREFAEETHIDVEMVRSLGICDFFVAWARQEYTHEHHITAIYEVRYLSGHAATETAVFDGQDSAGAEWIDPHRLSLDNASPVLMQAVQWLQTGELNLHAEHLDNWVVKG